MCQKNNRLFFTSYGVWAEYFFGYQLFFWQPKIFLLLWSVFLGLKRVLWLQYHLLQLLWYLLVPFQDCLAFRIENNWLLPSFHIELRGVSKEWLSCTLRQAFCFNTRSNSLSFGKSRQPEFWTFPSEFFFHFYPEMCVFFFHWNSLNFCRKHGFLGTYTRPDFLVKKVWAWSKTWVLCRPEFRLKC